MIKSLMYALTYIAHNVVNAATYDLWLILDPSDPAN